jgi:uncharacterized repeat protein (TIGR03803 family)
MKDLGLAITITNCLRTSLLGLAAAGALLAQTTQWTLTTLSGFGITGVGAFPYSGVTIGKGGALYGTAPSTYGVGGGDGVIYELTPPTSPGGAWTEDVRYPFGELGPSGVGPLGSVVIGADGVLYGTTSLGGASGAGIVFSLTPVPQQYTWTLDVLYNFAGGSDGASPQTTLVMGKGGMLYGTTQYGGTGDCFVSSEPPGCGTVFSLTPPTSPGGAWTETVLHTFTGGAEGALPNGVTLGPGGVLYGTTQVDGIVPCLEQQGCGTVFSLTPPASPGGAWTRKTIYQFAGPPNDGAHPLANLVIDGEVIYGTTYQGGPSGIGTVFSMTRPASAGGAWTESVLHGFADPVEGEAPRGLTLSETGTLYGVTQSGGSSRNYGTVFEMKPPTAPGGSWTYRILYNFTGGSDGSTPIGAPVIGPRGVLYGTTEGGGINADGTVFELAP